MGGRKIWIVFLTLAVSLMVTACGGKEAGGSAAVSPSEAGVTAEIVKSGTPDDLATESETVAVSLVSWDLGRSGNGDAVLCLKLHVKNKSTEQMEIGNLFHAAVFIDGVEADGFITDFYGDGRSFSVFEDTGLRSGAEADIYFCYGCTTDAAHKIEIDVYDTGDLQNGIYFLSDTILDTLKFSID